jgi:hypothetical protein
MDEVEKASNLKRLNVSKFTGNSGGEEEGQSVKGKGKVVPVLN